MSEAQLRAADEVWLSAATRGVLAVTRLDGQPVGDGKPGPLWRRMHGLLDAYWREEQRLRIVELAVVPEDARGR